MYQTQRTEFANLYVSKDAVKVKQIRDYLGNKIFENLDEELSGWIFALTQYLLLIGIIRVNIFL